MNSNFKYQDEFTLLQKLRESDTFAFRFIYNSYYAPLCQFGERFVKDSRQSEDIVTECFVTIWQKRTEFHTLKGLIAFLYTCTRNACLTHIRKTQRHESSHLEIAFLSSHNEELENAEELKNDLSLCSLFESLNLPPGMKKIFQLLYIEGFSTSEIAEKLKLSVYTVRAQRSNALKKIRAGLSKKGLLSCFF